MMEYNFNDEKIYNYNTKEEAGIDNFVANVFMQAENMLDIVQDSFKYDELVNLENYKEYLFYSLSAFTAELYFKTLIFYFDANNKHNTRIKEHKLSDLYDMFNEDASDDAKDILDKLLLANDGINISEELKHCEDTFIKFRYGYEIKAYSLNVSFLWKLVLSLQETCKQVLPPKIISAEHHWYKCAHYENGVYTPENK